MPSSGLAIAGWQPGPVARAEQCPAGRVPLMILGTYHMANPGLDAVNLDADDVLSARRQAEIDRVVQALAEFKPTKDAAVDFPMFMSGLTPAELVNESPAPSRPTPAAATASASTPPRPSPVSAEEALLRRSTVAAYLAHVNSDTSVAANASPYPNMLAPDSTAVALYAKADLVANWYKRNLRIFANVWP